MRGPVSTADVQAALAAHGFDPGPVDGIRGRRTVRALKAFQTSNDLPATGLVDAATAAALLGPDAAKADLPDAMPWLDEGQRMKGLHEALHNDEVTAFLASDGGTVGDPAVHPWCADFVQTCLALTLPEEPLPTNPYASISWARFGAPVRLCRGATLCFWRDSPDSWKGHVGFCIEWSDDHILTLGGNQGDSISEKWIERKFLRDGGVRWPVTALAPASVGQST